jgi:hypothetical protein
MHMHISQAVTIFILSAVVTMDIYKAATSGVEPAKLACLVLAIEFCVYAWYTLREPNVGGAKA